MTAHDKNSPDAPASRTDTAPDIPVAHARRDKATVIVWQISTDTGGDDDTAGNSDASDSPRRSRLACDAGDSPLTSRLARYLVAIYSDVHGTVIDFDADANLRHAAETTGRNYLAVTNPAGPAASAGQPGPAGLIMLRWPRPATTAPGHDANSLLSACQQHLADDGSTIVVVATAGAAGTSYGEHEQVLLRAAEAAGLRHLHDIVPLDADDGRDVFTYATAHDTTASSRDSDSDTPREITSITLGIFGHPGETTVTPRDNDLGGGRQNQRRGPVTRDTAAGQRDKDLPPRDRDDSPTLPANESSHAAALGAASRAPDGIKIELPKPDPGRHPGGRSRPAPAGPRSCSKARAARRPAASTTWE